MRDGELCACEGACGVAPIGNTSVLRPVTAMVPTAEGLGAGAASVPGTPGVTISSNIQIVKRVVCRMGMAVFFYSLLPSRQVPFVDPRSK